MPSGGAQKIGPYVLKKTLGVGSFSKVKLAVHEPTGNESPSRY